MPDAPTVAWSEAVDQFMAFLAEEERSEHTRRNYHADINAFARWYGDRSGEDPELRRVTKRDVLDWKLSVEATGGRKGGRAELPTVNRKLAAIRSFLRWTQEQELSPRFDPPRPARRQKKAEPRWLDKSEERALVAIVEASNSDRDLAILYLGLHGGLRVAEMWALDWSDVSISERKGELKVRKGKGNKERDVKLSKTLRSALIGLGGSRPKGPLLRNGAGNRLSIRGLQDIIERWGKQARVGKTVGLEDFSAHVLRHTCARRMLETGQLITTVAAHLGHADVKTTMGYLTPADADMTKAVCSLDAE
jgi:integrase